MGAPRRRRPFAGAKARNNCYSTLARERYPGVAAASWVSWRGPRAGRLRLSVSGGEAPELTLKTRQGRFSVGTLELRLRLVAAHLVRAVVLPPRSLTVASSQTAFASGSDVPSPPLQTSRAKAALDTATRARRTRRGGDAIDPQIEEDASWSLRFARKRAGCSAPMIHLVCR